MSTQKFKSALALTGLLALSLSLPAWASDGLIRAIRFDPASHQFLIDATGPVHAIVNTLTIAGNKRVIVDIDNAEIGTELPRDSQLLADLMRRLPTLRNVTVNQYGGANGRPIVRVLFDIESDLKTIRLLKNQGTQLALEIHDSAQTGALPSYQRPFDQAPELPDLSLARPQAAENSGSAAQVAALQQELSRLRSENGGLQNRLSEIASAQAASQNASDDAQRRVQALQSQMDALARENNALQAQLSVKSGPDPNSLLRQQEVEHLKQTNQTLQARIRQLQSAKPQPDPAMQAELSRLRADNQSMQNRLQQVQNAGVNAAQVEIDRLKQQNDSLKSAYDEAVRLGADRQKLELTTRDAEIARLRNQTADLQAQLRQMSSATTNAVGLEDLKRTLVRLNQQYDLLQQENIHLQADNEQMRAQASANAVPAADLAALRQQLTTAQQSLNSSIATINEQNKEIAYLRNQVTDLKAGMDTQSREQLARMQSAADEKDARIRALESQLAAAQSSPVKSTATQQEIAVLKRQMDQMTVQYKSSLDDLNRQVQVRQTQLQERERQLTEARGQAAQVDGLERQVASLQSQLDDANRHAADAQANATRIQAAAPSADELKKRDGQIVFLQGEVTRLKTQLDSTQKDLTALKASKTSQASASDASKSLIASLQDETTRQKSQLADLTAKSDEKERQLAALTAQNEDKDKLVSALKSQLEADGQQMAALQADLQKARQAKPAAPASGSTTVLQKQVADLNRQLADTRKQVADLKKQQPLATAATAPSTAVKASSFNAEAEQHYATGKAALTAGNTDNAVDELNRAQLLDPDNSRIANDYAAALAADGRGPDAIDYLRRYLQRNAADRDAYNQLGKLYLLNDQADAASEAFSRAIPVGTLNNYATSLKKLDRMEDAETVFKMALKLNPNDSEVLFNLGNLYNAENKMELARNNYLQAIQIKPDFAEAHYNLGLVYSKLGRNADAVIHLEKFLQLSPGARNADVIRAYVTKLKA